MPKIYSVGTFSPPYRIEQETAVEFAKEIFEDSYEDIERMLQVFANGQIKKRHISAPLDWFKKERSLEEKNRLYIEKAVEYGSQAIQLCLENPYFLREQIPYNEIDAIIFISSTGIATPSIEARIMNHLPFSVHLKRIPIWGLGCAGGAAGLSRAYEYCLAFPKAKVLIVCVELCSLTFQLQDKSKSNLVGTSLFADGAAAALICGDQSDVSSLSYNKSVPRIQASQSTLLPNSEDVMGWDVKDEGLFVVFSRSIPQIVKKWLGHNVIEFLEQEGTTLGEIELLIAHPGGRKVLEAYREALQLPEEMTYPSITILKEFGNMSSVTVLFVLEKIMKMEISPGTKGLITALGPGFSSELLLAEWQTP